MSHYICTGGCKGVSEDPGTCQAEICPKNLFPLKECSCENGKHGMEEEKSEEEVAETPQV